jgi:hypothetical protein
MTSRMTYTQTLKMVELMFADMFIRDSLIEKLMEVAKEMSHSELESMLQGITRFEDTQ